LDHEVKNEYSRTNLFPLAQLAAGFASGILLSQTAARFFLIVCVSILFTLGALTFLVCNRIRLATVSLLLAFAFCGATLTLLELRTPEPERIKRLLEDGVVKSGGPIEITGVLQRNPEVSWESVYLTLNVEQIRTSGSDLAASGVVTLSGSIPADREKLQDLELRYGARIRVMTTLERANSFRNPGVSPFTEYLDRKGYDATGFIKSLRLIERLEDERVFLPLAWVYDWRNDLQYQFDSQFTNYTAGVLDAALLGNRHNLSHSVEERFRDGGTFHVLVISGLHITFLGGLVFVITRRLTKNRATQFIACVAVVWAYSIAVGAEPSILRAALMFSVVMLAPLVSRRASPLNGLGAVAIGLLLWKPSSLLDPSFQLTFVSVLAILVLAWPLLNNLAAIGLWRPARVTPYPPSCPHWVRRLSESLYWNESEGARDLQRANHKYRLLKSPAAKTLQRMHAQRVLRFAFAAMVVSISVQIALLPFLIVYFHRFSLASFVLNIFVGLVMGGLALTALGGVVVSLVSSVLSEPLIFAANGLNWLMVHSVDPFARARIASIRLPEYTSWPASLYVIYYVPLTTLAICLSKWKPMELPKNGTGTLWKRWILSVAVSGQLIAITLMIVHPLSTVENEGKLRIDFLDVGQGDAALITFPDSTTILVDGGGRPGPFKSRVADIELERSEREMRSIGESVVSEYLWWRGLKRIDYLIATHADADHIDGLNDITRNFHVRAALVAGIPSRDPEFAELSKSFALRNVPVRVIGAGDELRLGKVSLKVLWPLPSAGSMVTSGNNDSMVLRLEFGARAILLTGDIESETENVLVEHYQSLLASDVTKVAHHGSRTSSTERFVAAAKSTVAVISVGESSVFGHPHAEVVERWKARGAQVLTTGKRGMVTLITDGHEMQVTTFVNP
jgi:competence protein ComEC